MRACLSVPVLIESDGRRHSARLRDISETGAMIEAAMAFPKGSHIVLSAGSLEADGIVAWDHENCSGITFDAALDESDVARQLLRSSAVAQRRRLVQTVE